LNTQYTRRIFILLLLAFLCFGAVVLSISTGASKISVREIISTFFSDGHTLNYQIIRNIRLPRTLVAMLAGLSLAVSGAILQGVMRNPLASPNIIGVSSGAGVMAVFIMIVLPDYFYLITPGAFIGAMLTTILIYFLSWQNGIRPLRMILAGVAVSSFFSAIISGLMIFYPDRVHGVIDFMVGGLAASTWRDVEMIWPYALGCFAVVNLLANKLNIMLLGDETAVSLGLRVEILRMIFIAIAALLAASSVSVVGLLGFVGLIVPHIARIIAGSDYRVLFPASALLGMLLLTLCDTLARVVLSPADLPVGIIMALLGAPFFLYLLRKGLQGHAA